MDKVEIIDEGNVKGVLYRDTEGRPRAFYGQITDGRYGVWAREYRKHIPIKVLEEVKIPSTDRPLQWRVNIQIEYDIEWINNNGINTPYNVTWINKEDK